MFGFARHCVACGRVFNFWVRRQVNEALSSFLCMQRSVWGRLGGLLSVVVAFGRTARAWWLDLIFSSLALTLGCYPRHFFFLFDSAGRLGETCCLPRDGCRFLFLKDELRSCPLRCSSRAVHNICVPVRTASLHKISEEIYRKLLENLGPRKHRAISSSRTN